MVEINKELKRDIKKLGGDGSRKALCAMLEKTDAANRELSSALPRTDFSGILRRHGRAVVAVALAATLCEREERLDGWNIMWARAILNLLPFVMYPNTMQRISIHDNVLHPTAICDYAGKFIKLTMEV